MSGMPDKDDVLKAMAKTYNTGVHAGGGHLGGEIKVVDLARYLKVSALRAQVCLDRLENDGLVEPVLEDYRLTPDGRAYIVERDLDKEESG